MKGKGKLSLLFIMLICVGCFFVGCNKDPYKDLSISLDKTDFTYTMGENEDNTFVVKSTIDGVKNKQSGLSFFSFDNEIVSIVDTVNTSNVTTVTFKALKGGVVNIKAVSAEGNKQASVKVNIIKPIENFTFASDTLKCVVGDTLTLDETSYVFYPSDTNQKEISLSLKESRYAEFIEIKENQITVREEFPTSINSIYVVATSKSNNVLVREIELEIIRPITASDNEIKILNSENQEITEIISIIANREEYSEKEIALQFKIKSLPDITYEMSESGILEIENYAGYRSQVIGDETFYTFNYTLKQNNIGKTKLTFYASYPGNSKIWKLGSVDVEVLELPNIITINGSYEIVEDIIITDVVNSSYRGYELNIDVLPKTVNEENGKVKVVIPKILKDNIDVYNGNLQIIEFIEDENDNYYIMVNNGAKLFIKAKSAVTDQAFNNSYNIEFYTTVLQEFGYNELKVVAPIKIVKGITSFDILGERNYNGSYGYVNCSSVYLDLMAGTQAKLKIDNILPINSYKGNIKVFVRNEDIAQIQFTNDFSFTVTGKEVGNTTIVVESGSDIVKVVNVEVVCGLEYIRLSTDSENDETKIGYLTKRKVTDEIVSNFENQTIDYLALVKSNLINLNLQTYPKNATIFDTSLTSNHSGITTNSYSLSIYGSQEVLDDVEMKVTTKYKKVSSDGLSYTTQQVENKFKLICYIPITNIDIEISKDVLYNYSTVGSYEYNLSETEIIFNGNNESFNKLENINWTLTPLTSETIIEGKTTYLANECLEFDVETLSLRAIGQKGTEDKIVYLTARIDEGGFGKKIFEKEIAITVKSAVSVENIYIENSVDEIYLDANNPSFKFVVSSYPENARNKTIIYNFIPDEGVDEDLVSISSTGFVEINSSNKGGSGRILIASQDWFLDSMSMPDNYKTVRVYVGDGTKENPIRISNEEQLKSINNEQGLKLHYVVYTTITLSENFIPLGFVQDNNGYKLIEFTGSINFKSPDNVYQGKITNLTLNKLYTYNNISYSGLIAVVGASGEINNINLSCYYNMNETSSNDTFIGSVSAVNKGNIINPVVNILSRNEESTVRVNADQINTTKVCYIGGVTGANKESGSIYFDNHLTIASSTLEVFGTGVKYVGSIAGYNSNKMEGTDNNVSNLKINYHFSAINNGDLSYQNSCLGGVVGYNDAGGILNNIHVNCSLTGYNNLGGVVGYNKGIISNCYSTSKIEGNSAIGGIAGISENNITNCIVENFNNNLSYKENTLLSGVSDVGGIVGSLKAGTVELCAFISYVNKKFSFENQFNNYIGDIYVSGTTSTVGGIVGRCLPPTGISLGITLNRCMADCKISSESTNLYVGGLIGFIREISVSIQNCSSNVSVLNNYTLDDNSVVLGSAVGYYANITNYSQQILNSISLLNVYSESEFVYNSKLYNNQNGSIILENVYYVSSLEENLNGLNNVSISQLQELDIEQAFGENADSIWNRQDSVFDSMPYLLNDSGDSIKKLSPIRIDVSVKQTNETNTYLKADFDKVVLFVYKSNNAEDNLYLADKNVYSLQDFLNLSIYYVAGAREDFRLLEFNITSSNSNILKITDDNDIRVLNEGYCKVTISNKIDDNIKTSVEIFVCNAVTSFNVYNNRDNFSVQNELGNLNNYLIIKKLIVSNIYPYFNTVLVENNKIINLFQNSVNYAVSINYTSRFSNDRNITINGDILTTNYKDVSLNDLINLYATDFTNGVITCKPAVQANFDGVIYYVSFFDKTNGINDGSDNLNNKQFNLSVTQGANKIVANKENVSIFPENELEIKISVYSDYFDEDIIISNSDYFTIFTNSEKIVKYNKNGQILKREGSEIVVYNNKGERVVGGDQSLYLIEKTFKLNVKKDKVNTNEIIKTNLLVNVLSNQLQKEINISILPQSIKDIKDELYLNKEDIVIHNTSDVIITGSVAFDKVMIFPYFASFDYLDILYENKFNTYIGLEAIAIINEQLVENLHFVQIENGIRIYKDSFTSYIGNNALEIYIRILLASNTTTGSELTLTYNAYRASGYLQGLLYTYQKSYFVESINEVKISLDKNEIQPNVYSDYFSLEGKDYYYLAQNTKKKIYLQNEGYTSEPSFKIGNGFVKVNTLSNGEYELVVNSNLNYSVEQYNTQFGGIFDQVTVIYTKEVNGVQVPKSYTINIIILDYVINGITISNVVDEKLTGSLGNNFNLKVNILSSYDKYNNQVAMTISNFEKVLSNNLSNWYWYNLTDGVYNQNYVNLSDLENYSFTNFNLIDLQNNDLKARYQIKPININNTDRFKFSCIYIYENGIAKVSNSYSGNTNQFVLNNAFTLNVFQNTDENSPIPIWNVSEFTSKLTETGYYILMNDIVLPSDYESFSPGFTSLDGNNKKIIITGKSETEEAGYSVGCVFNTIGVNQIVKNVKVSLNNRTVVFDYMSATNLSFGVLAYYNRGIIYNCEICDGGIRVEVPDTTVNSASLFKVAGFVCYNAGYITNSRCLISVSSYGFVSGFMIENSGSVSSSYFYGADVTNRSVNTNTSQTAGFVLTNTATGKISGCYIEGKYSYDYNVEDVSKTYGADLNSIISAGRTSAFVYTNSGTVSDCFADITVTSNSKATGFVFVNNGGSTSGSGFISNCYTTCKLINNTDNKPFISEDERNNINNTGTIQNCYYLDNSKTPIIDERLNGMISPVKAYYESGDRLDLIYFNNQNTFENFAFSLNSIARTDAVWFMTTVGKDIDFNNKIFRPFRPNLTSANIISVGSRILDRAEYNEETNNYTYYYIYEDGVDNYGTKYNPIVLYDAMSFNNEFTQASNNTDKIVNLHFRIISDITFGGNYQMVNTSNINFMGTLDGNNMKLIGFSVYSTLDNLNAGLFAQITSDGVSQGCVKNLILAPYVINASNTTCVGTLAGTLNNANIFNITVNGRLANASGAVVQGRNCVGGVVGRALGDFQIIGIETSIYVNASFRIDAVSTNKTYTKPYYIYNDLNNITKVSYAGGIIGVSESTRNGYIRKINMNTQNIVVGEIVGGVAGLIGENVVLSTVNYYAALTSYINAARIAGGLVGENRGTIQYCTLSNLQESQKAINNLAFGSISNLAHTKFFTGNCLVTGGLVGFNNGGVIENSVCKLDVINTSSEIVGGFVGRLNAGEILSCQVYGSVKGKYVMGGFIGALTESRLLSGSLFNQINVDCISMITRTNLGEINLINNYISNNWVTTDVSYYFMKIEELENDSFVTNYYYSVVVAAYIGVVQKASNYPTLLYFGQNSIKPILLQLNNEIFISSEYFKDGSIYPLNATWTSENNTRPIQVIGSETDSSMKLNVSEIINHNTNPDEKPDIRYLYYEEDYNSTRPSVY